jgi:hypothetical protein
MYKKRGENKFRKTKMKNEVIKKNNCSDMSLLYLMVWVRKGSPTS